MIRISSALFLTSIILPLLHFSFPPTQLNLKKLQIASLASRGYVINLVQAGCPFCLYEIPYFNEFSKKCESLGITCILVSTSDDEESLQIFRSKAPDTHLISYDPGLFYPQCSFDGYPFFIFADKQGRVLSTMLGVPDDIDRYLNTQMELLLP